MDKLDLASSSLEEITSYMAAIGQPAFRARQLFRQVQKLKAADFAAMSDLPLALRGRLEQETLLTAPRVVAERVSRAGDTAKLLLEFADGERVETALMLYRRAASRDRATCCLSSQSGCAMGCVFCASGLFRSLRNLTAGEMVAQAQLADTLARRFGFPGLTNIVYMGMGEPLLNSAQVRRSIELINDSQGLNIGARRITVSTCGIVPQIYAMAGWGLQIGLAVSLHSADEAKRKQLMPGAARWSVRELLAACLYYQKTTGRRVTCEYALIKGVNDSAEDARLLGNLLTGSQFLVNIIPANALPERGVSAPDPAAAVEFCRIAGARGVEIQIRESRGNDIEAACGQLRKRTRP